MFRISLDLKQSVHTGIEALDMRRRFKLRDDSLLTWKDCESIACQVPEWFARAYFGKTNRTECADVDPLLLTPEDVEDKASEHSPSSAGFRPDLTEKRIMELFVAARNSR